MRFWRRAISAAIGAALLASACGVGASNNTVGAVPTPVDDPSPKLPVTVASADGRRVTISDVSRLVPLWGNLSETVFALGLGGHVVARDISTTFEQAKDLPLVTRSHEVTAEAVLSQHPTLVLADEQSGPPEALRQIRDAGVPVIVFQRPTNVAEIGTQIRRIATALGVKEQGLAVAADAMREIDDITAALPHPTKRPRVAFLYMRGNAGVALMAGPGSGVDSMINSAGGRDAGTAIRLAKSFTPLTSEALVKAKPDVILMTTTGLASVGGVDGLLQVPGVAQTPAGRDRRVVTMEDGLLFSFGTRTATALRTLSNAFYQS